MDRFTGRHYFTHDLLLSFYSKNSSYMLVYHKTTEFFQFSPTTLSTTKHSRVRHGGLMVKTELVTVINNLFLFGV